MTYSICNGKCCKIPFFSYVCLTGYIGLKKTASAPGNTKWDGVLFKVENKTVTPVFVELSGGINFNTTDKKEIDDEK